MRSKLLFILKKRHLLDFFGLWLLFFFWGIATEVVATEKKALIFGVTGQDGSYLSQFLIDKGYEVHGVARHGFPASSPLASLTDHPRFFFHLGDIQDPLSPLELIEKIKPDEVYNLAAQTQVKLSFEKPRETALINALGTLHILEAIRQLGLEKQCKFFQASSSELFGPTSLPPQAEETAFHPTSPYGIAKLYAYWITQHYKTCYGIFSCNGILFNHESPLRSEAFVSRKITRAACRYALNPEERLFLGNLEALRDWGFAQDFVEAMWLMLQQEHPEDFVIATGRAHSVREFVSLAFRAAGVEIEWKGEGLEEVGIDKQTGQIIIRVDPRYYRPLDSHLLLGNAQKAAQKLNWQPRTSFEELVKIMIEADYARLLEERDALLP